MADATPRLDEAAPVREGEQLDPARLRPFLEAAFPGAAGAVEVLQFPSGHSNLTYLVRLGDREAVLRRAPFGTTVKGAHDMGREFRLLSALQAAYPLAPRPLAFCDDPAILGAPFYLMARVRGLVLRGDGRSAGIPLTPSLLRATSTALVDALAGLHALDLERTGLLALGRPEGYVGRQVKGWTDRYAAAATEAIPTLEAAAAWLAAHQPPGRGAALVHNDFKYDNVVLDPADPARIVAVLDWEMATVGDPLMDLGTALGYWIDADDPAPMRAHPMGPTHLPGGLSRREVVERYAARSGRPVEGAVFYYVFALFKLAGILQQIYRRFVDGHTRDPRFGPLIHTIRALGDQAARALDRDRIDRLGD